MLLAFTPVTPRSSQTRQVLLVPGYVLGFLLLGLLAVEAFAQTDLGTVRLQGQPGSVAVNPVTNTVYVLLPQQELIVAVNGVTHETRSIDVGVGAMALAVNPVANEIYVANVPAGTVTLINGATLSTRTVKVGTNPRAIAADVQTHQIYVADESSNDVDVIDGASGTLTKTIPVGKGPIALALNAVTDRIYVANSGSPELSVIDGASATLKATVRLPHPLVAVKLNSITNRIFVADDTGVLSAISGASNGVVGTRSFSPPLSLEINPDADQVVVAAEDEVAVVTGNFQSISQYRPVAGPASIAVDTKTNFIYVITSGLLSTIDGNSLGITQMSEAGFGNNISAVVNPVTSTLYVGQPASAPALDVIDVTQTSSQTIQGAPNTSFADSFAALNSLNGFVYVASLTGAETPGNVDIFSVTGTPHFVGRVLVGARPLTPVANPVTGLVYVPNQMDHTLSVINGTSVQATIPLGFIPTMLASNPVTNKVYTAALNSNKIAVLDGATDGLQLVTVGFQPSSLAINIATNIVWVANTQDGTVSAIDGSTLAVSAPVPVGSQPSGIAVDAVSNLVYVANSGSDTVSVLDGSTRMVVATIPVGSEPGSILINPALDLIYVANGADGTVSTIDGGRRTVLATSAVGPGVIGLRLDPLRNKVYTQTDVIGSSAVVNPGGAVEQLTGDNFALPDPATGLVYAGNSSGPSQLDVLTLERTGFDPLTNTITPVSDAQTMATAPLLQTRSATPAFQIDAVSDYTDIPDQAAIVQPPPTSVYYSVDGGTWTRQPASSPIPSSAVVTITLPPTAPGEHRLFTYATYGDEGSFSVDPEAQSPVIGEITSLPFLIDPPAVAVVSTLNVTSTSIAFGTASATLTATLTYGGTMAPTGAVSFSVDGGTAVSTTCNGTVSPQMCTVSYSAATLASGTHTITVTEAADASYAAASATGTLTVQPASGTVVISAANTITAQGDGTRQLSISLTNTGTGSAQLVTLTGLTVGAVSCTPMPQMLGTIDPQHSASALCTVPATAGASGTTVVEKLLGGYQGGNFSGSYRIKLP